MSANCEVAKFRVLSINCDVSSLNNISQKSGKDGITLKVEDNLSFRRSRDESKKIVLLEIRTNLASEDAPEFKMSLVSQALFNIEEIPEDLEKALQIKYYPLARNKVYEAIKKITEAMCIPPIDLNAQKESV